MLILLLHVLNLFFHFALNFICMWNVSFIFWVGLNVIENCVDFAVDNFEESGTEDVLPQMYILFNLSPVQKHVWTIEIWVQNWESYLFFRNFEVDWHSSKGVIHLSNFRISQLQRIEEKRVRVRARVASWYSVWIAFNHCTWVHLHWSVCVRGREIARMKCITLHAAQCELISIGTYLEHFFWCVCVSVAWN